MRHAWPISPGCHRPGCRGRERRRCAGLAAVTPTRALTMVRRASHGASCDHRSMCKRAGLWLCVCIRVCVIRSVLVFSCGGKSQKKKQAKFLSAQGVYYKTKYKNEAEGFRYAIENKQPRKCTERAGTKQIK